VFWENLTVEEHIKIWRKLKTAAYDDQTIQNDDDDVLAECDLHEKAKAAAKTLSGGQMRKLQLAISFVGGSKVCCIDEASSGLDPLSRRNIWNIIQKGHSRRTILVTTHFLGGYFLSSLGVQCLATRDTLVYPFQKILTEILLQMKPTSWPTILPSYIKENWCARDQDHH
jgi:ABC-type Mn2+/Zn2+ transport system ATPase subunit